MGKDKDMNPVMKMRKKEKQKEREKRREIKMARKKYEDNTDDIDDTYNPNTISELKAGKSLDKKDKDHYQQKPLTWDDLQNNLMTGTIDRSVNDSYGYYSGTQNSTQQPGNGYQNYQNQPPPKWEGDTLVSQPVLYNQEQPLISAPPLPGNSLKDPAKDKRKNMTDEFDPLNPNKAKQNFKKEAYKTAEEREAEEKAKNPPEKKEIAPEVEKFKQENEKLKEKEKQKEGMSKPSFVPAALRKKKRKQGSQVSQIRTIEPQEQEEHIETHLEKLLNPSAPDPSPIITKPESVEPSKPVVDSKEVEEESAKEHATTTDAFDSLFGMYD